MAEKTAGAGRGVSKTDGNENRLKRRGEKRPSQIPKTLSKKKGRKKGCRTISNAIRGKGASAKRKTKRHLRSPVMADREDQKNGTQDRSSKIKPAAKMRGRGEWEM